MNLADVITQAAQRYGIDPAAMIRVAQLESGMRPGARNPNSTASGLFQFIDSTWRQYGRGDVMDPLANTDAAGRYLADVQRHLQGVLGRAPTGWELYFGHQQGMGGAAALLRNPQARAVDALIPVYGSETAARRAIALNIPRDAGLHADTVTAGQFADLWRSRFDRKPRTQASTSTSTAPEGFRLDPQAIGSTFATGLDLIDGQLEPGREVSFEDRVISTITDRMMTERAQEPVCPPGTYYDPVMQACFPVPQDDKRFRLQETDPVLSQERPLDRFASIFENSPGLTQLPR